MLVKKLSKSVIVRKFMCSDWEFLVSSESQQIGSFGT